MLTATVQVPPAGTAFTQLLEETAKFVDTVTDAGCSAPVPTFCSVTICAGLTAPICEFPNITACGVATAARHGDTSSKNRNGNRTLRIVAGNNDGRVTRTDASWRETQRNRATETARNRERRSGTKTISLRRHDNIVARCRSYGGDGKRSPAIEPPALARNRLGIGDAEKIRRTIRRLSERDRAEI